MSKRLSAFVFLSLMYTFGHRAEGSIIYDVPNGLTTQPNNDPRWNSTVQLSDGGGTIIASDYFLTAQHLNSGSSVGAAVKLVTKDAAGNQATNNYIIASIQNIAGTDLRIAKINGTFPSTASIIPLYSSPAGTEAGQAVSFLGYGNHQQGSAVSTTIGATTVQNGWIWAGATGVKSFGQNTISSVDPAIPGQSALLDYQFQPISGQNEAIYANRDSGGGTFIHNGGVYQLAGVNYGVDQFYSNTGTVASPVYTAINGAIFDSTGLYVNNSLTATPHYVLATSLGITDQHGYATEIAPYYNTIRADIPEPASLVMGGLCAFGFMIFRRPRRCC